jgi:hypothetical protein
VPGAVTQNTSNVGRRAPNQPTRHWGSCSAAAPTRGKLRPRLVARPRTFTVLIDTRSACDADGVVAVKLCWRQIPYTCGDCVTRRGQQLLRITRSGTGSPIRLRRAWSCLPRPAGTRCRRSPAWFRQTRTRSNRPSTLFHDGDGQPGPSVGGWRPRQIIPEEEQFIVTTANTRPEASGRPFTR